MDELTYRELPEDRESAFDRMIGYAFRPQNGPPDAETGVDDDEDEGQDVGERRGMFDGDDLLAVCRQIYWPSEVRGESVRLAGLSAVASPPESRRKGVVARMLEGSFEEYHDRGCAFAALWPFRRSFYAKYGYGTANCFVALELPVETLSFSDDGENPCEFHPVDEDEWERLDGVYRDHVADLGLAIERNEEWWRRRVFQHWETDPYVYAVERGAETVGYVTYTIEEDDDSRNFRGRDMAWTDREAFRELLRFVYYHDSQVDSVELYGRPGGAFRDLLDRITDANEEGVEYRTHPGPMVRIVDVPAALETIPYPDGVEDSLVVDVSDPLADRNDGTFVLSVSDGTGTCHPGDGQAPDLECSVAALSQAAVGYRPVERLARVGDLAGEDDAIDRLGTLLPPADVFLRDFF